MAGQRTLIFDDIDALSNANAASQLTLVTSALPGSIGPIVELDWMRTQQTRLPAISSLPRTKRSQAYLRSIANPGPVIIRDGNRQVGFVQVSWDHKADDPDFYSFCSAGERAAREAGIDKTIAVKLIAGLQELEDNIHLHSENSASGLLGFTAMPGEFEFVVADKGIGILQSLRKNSAFHNFIDHGEAIDAAVREGASRYGPRSGHANGFRAVITGLYNLRCLLRFRSGDHVLSWLSDANGQGKAQLRQVLNIPGFIVCMSWQA